MLSSDPSTTPGFAAAGHAVLACIRPDGGAAGTVAAAARLALLAGASWHAVLVENAATRRLGEAARLAALELLRAAQAQGAVTAVLEGRDAAAAVAAYAQRHGCATVVLARSRPAAPWRTPFARRLNIHLHSITWAPHKQQNVP